MARDGLSGERRGVELGRAVDDDTVDWHALARLDNDDGTGADLGGVDLLKLAVLLDVCIVRRDVHHGRDGLAALAHGVALEELAHLVEEHDCGAFGHVGLGLGEQYHRESAERRNRHEEGLVEGIPSANVARGLEQGLVAGDEVGDEEEGKARVDVARRAKDVGEKPRLLHDHHCREDRERDDDAIAPAALLLVHNNSSANWGQSPIHVKLFC